MPYFQRFGTTDPEAYRPRSLRGYRSLRGPRSLPGQHRQNALDVVTELRHVVAQELLGLCFEIEPSSPKTSGENWMYASGAVIWRALQKLSTAAQALLGERRADRTDRGADHRGGDVVERVLPPGSRRPVDGVLQCARDGAVVLRRDEEHGIRAAIACFSALAAGGKSAS